MSEHLIKDPQILAKLAKEKDRLRAAAAFDSFQSELDDALKAKSKLPEIEGKIASLERAIARPLAVTATVKEPEKPKGTVKTPKCVEATFDASTAEFIRRVNGSTIKSTLEELRPGPENRLMRKSATDIATGSHVGWAAELTRSGEIAWVEQLAKTSIFGALAKAGQALPMGRNSSITAPSRGALDRGSMAAAFAAPGATLPVKSGNLAGRTFHAMKCGVISVFSNELANVSTPMIRDVIQSMVLSDTSEMLDAVLLDPTNAGVGTIRPASPWYNAATLVSHGQSIEQILADLEYLMGQIYSGQPRKPALIMDEGRKQRLRMRRENGQFLFRDDIEAGHLFGVPLLTSNSVPTDKIYSIDQADFASWSPSPEIDLSAHATLTMADDDGVAPTMADTNAINDNGGSIHISDAADQLPPAEVRSTFQTNCTAFRHIQEVSFGTVRAGTAAWMSAVTW